MRRIILTAAAALLACATASSASAAPSDAGVLAALASLKGTAVARVMAPARPLDPDYVRRLGVIVALEEARETCPAVKRVLETNPSFLSEIAMGPLQSASSSSPR